MGRFTAGLVFAVAPLFMATVAWYIPVVAGFRSMVFPYIYKSTSVSTSLLGSCWSVGLSADPVMIGVFWVGGIVLQLILGSAPRQSRLSAQDKRVVLITDQY